MYIDSFSSGGTEDSRSIIEHIHHEYPNAFTIFDRFINRKFVQKLYDKALGAGLVGYAKLYVSQHNLLPGFFYACAIMMNRLTQSLMYSGHQTVASQLTDWNSIAKTRSIRDFDNYFTCVIEKFETVDTYYRRSSSVNYVGNVAVPLLCISALDDPVCTRESIPWKECRMNPNIVLAATDHGGHLAYYEGITATNMWVRAASEFLEVLRSSPLKDMAKKVEPSNTSTRLESKIDQGPFVNIEDDGPADAVAGIHKDDTTAATDDTSNVDRTGKEDSEEEESSKDVATSKKMDRGNNPDQSVFGSKA